MALKTNWDRSATQEERTFVSKAIDRFASTPMEELQAAARTDFPSTIALAHRKVSQAQTLEDYIDSEDTARQALKLGEIEQSYGSALMFLGSCSEDHSHSQEFMHAATVILMASSEKYAPV